MKHTIPDTTLVIGAGLSGLATARALVDRGLPVIVLEGRTEVAGPWRARHPALRLNIHRKFAGLPGQESPRTDGTFLRRDTVVGHIERYAAALNAPIHFGANVQDIAETVDGWLVTTQIGTYAAANVVIATGRDSIPHIPDWDGRREFIGELIHASALGDVSRFDGKRVLVVGAGNSATDALNHLSRHRPKEVMVAVRHGPAMVPQRIFGYPLHGLARVFAALPAWLLDPAFRFTEWSFLGDLRAYGLPRHRDGGGTRLLRDGIAFAIDDGFVDALHKKRFRVVPRVERFNRSEVILADGSVCNPDVVIAATGYQTGLEPLLGHLGALNERGLPLHPMGERDLNNPGLWFTGFKPIFTGYFDAAGIAANRIASSIAAHAATTRGRANSGVSLNRAAAQSTTLADARPH